MSLKKCTPCDCEGHCPYEVDKYGGNCEWYCSAEEPEDNYDEYDERW